MKYDVLFSSEHLCSHTNMEVVQSYIVEVVVYKFSLNLPENHTVNISTDNIDLPSDVQFKRSWMKKVSRHFEKPFPTGLQSMFTPNTKEKKGCHVCRDEHKAWSWPGAPERRLAQKRPGNKQPLKCLTDTQRSQTSPTHQTGVSQS